MKIQVQKIPHKLPTSEEILARFCYYFPQYKYSEAQKLPYKRVALMLKTAEKERVKSMSEIYTIVTAKGRKSNTAINNLISYYSKVLEE